MDKLLNFISLAQKAGKVKAGEYLTMKALKEGSAQLVVLASDTSEKSKARITRACESFSCRAIEVFEKSDLGHFIGAQSKSVLCLTDKGFADALLKKLAQSEHNQV